MPIEKSVFNELEIPKLLKQIYGISTDKVQQLHLGRANCFKVYAKEKIFFLKEYQQKFSEQDLQREAAIVRFLISQDFPTAEFIEDKNGNTYNFINNRYK